jgi:hypothetical protein
MELKDLVGEHVLTAVDNDTTVEIVGYSGEPRSANGMLFTLDGVTYRVIEDENDGYRSSAREIEVFTTSEPLRNRFTGCRVVCRYIDGQFENSPSNDLLELIDVVTGQTVLLVGTKDVDDYYPSYVANFTPENMASNQ